jgi:hypothetical protein
MTTTGRASSFLHVVAGLSAAGNVQAALNLLDREEVVLRTRDALVEGPLGDIEAGAQCRAEWWSRMGPKPLDDREARELDDTDLWAEVRAARGDVVLWHGPHPGERLFTLRACWHLCDQPQRIWEVRRAPRSSRTPGVLPAFYDAVGISTAEELVDAWAGRSRVADVGARAAQWEALRAQPGDWIRTLEGDAIVHHPVTVYDDDLVGACDSRGWTRAIHVIGRVLADVPTGDWFLGWRVRELLRTGELEGRGPVKAFGLPEEVRPARR